MNFVETDGSGSPGFSRWKPARWTSADEGVVKKKWTRPMFFGSVS